MWWVERSRERGDIDELLLLLEESKWARVVADAAYALAELGDRHGVEVLYRRLELMGRGPFVERERWLDDDWRDDHEHWDWVTLARALATLEGAGSPWADQLLSILTQEDTPTGWDAGAILAEIDDRRAIAPIIASLETADATAETEWGKWDALASALGELRAVEAVDVLAAALPAAYWPTQVVIAEALQEIGDSRAVPALAAELKAHHGYYGDPENAIWIALEGLGPTPEAKSAIGAYERSLHTPRRRLHRWLRWQIARAFGQLARAFARTIERRRRPRAS